MLPSQLAILDEKLKARPDLRLITVTKSFEEGSWDSVFVIIAHGQNYLSWCLPIDEDFESCLDAWISEAQVLDLSTQLRNQTSPLSLVEQNTLPCTYTLTGDKMINQYWMRCQTCFGEEIDLGVCLSCARRCIEENHDIDTNVAHYGRFYCDRGLKEASIASTDNHDD